MKSFSVPELSFRRVLRLAAISVAVLLIALALTSILQLPLQGNFVAGVLVALVSTGLGIALDLYLPGGTKRQHLEATTPHDQ